MAKFNLRIKTERNSAFEQEMSAESLKEVILHVSSKMDSISNAEITKDGKLFFVFTLDEKTRIFLRIIHQMSAEIPTIEAMPAKQKKERKVRSKPKKAA